jgi:hypothetical protein
MSVITSSFDTIELRRYAMQPGKRDVLIELFERAFIEGQEAAGMTPIGHYRVAGNPDTFIWFRGFESMQMRAASLEAFYRKSQVWKENRDAANATLVDSDNVLLLKTARPHSGFDLDGLDRPPAGASLQDTQVGLAIRMLDAPQTFTERFEAEILPSLGGDVSRIAYFVTDERENEFPALPVRVERAFCAVGVCRTTDAFERWRSAFDGHEFEVLSLQPGARSLFR